MAGRDKLAIRKYNSEFNRQRYHKKKADWIASLGGRCAKCGGTDRLQIDHVNPSQKSFAISVRWSLSPERIAAELAKCQALCRACHAIKTIYDKGGVPSRGLHGTPNSYRHCPCAICKAAKSKANLDYRSKNKEKIEQQRRRARQQKKASAPFV